MIAKPIRLDSNGNPAMCFNMPDTANTLKVDGTSASAATAAVIHATDETIVRIVADSDCYLLAGANPTALNNGTCLKMKSGTTDYFIVPPACKIAVIGGIIYITPQS
jgi:hypothetical protein